MKNVIMLALTFVLLATSTSQLTACTVHYSPSPRELPDITATSSSNLQSALMAYREFLTTSQRVEVTDSLIGTHESLCWDLDNIRHVELIDFDNDGVPELYLVVNLLHGTGGGFGGGDIDLLVVGYTEGSGVRVLYHGMSSFAHGFRRYSSIAAASDKRFYIFTTYSMAGGLNGYEDISVGIRVPAQVPEAGRTYYRLVNGEFTTVLTKSFIVDLAFDEQRIITDVHHYFFVNGERVSEAEFEAAPYNYLGIVEILNWWDSTSRNTPQDLLVYIDDRLANSLCLRY